MIKSKKKFNKDKGSKRQIYMDHASATPMDLRIISLMSNIFKKNFANPSGIHEMSLDVNKILENARLYIASLLKARFEEIIFTGGATENNNLAIRGIVAKFSEMNQKILPHIVTTNIEHPSVMEVCKYLEKTKQAEITFVPVEENGIVDPKKIKNALKPNTILVSVMYANNEIGTIQPIKEIVKEIRHYKKILKSNFSQVLGSTSYARRDHSKNYFSEFSSTFPIFYTDATQVVNYLPINVLKLGVDMLSFNGDKIYGPKDVGILYIKKDIPFSKIMFGGNQEFGIRPGTENTASIVGLSEALKINEKIIEKENKRLCALRDYFVKKITEIDSRIRINGDLKNRLPNNVNISIPKIPSDLVLTELSARGIYISEKSACKSGEKKSSYVIKALYKNDYGSLRFSLGRSTSKSDIDYTIKSLKEILQKLKKWYY